MPFVQGIGATSSGSVTSISQTYVAPVTAGNLLIVATGAPNSTLTSSVTDTQGNTYVGWLGQTSAYQSSYHIEVWVAVASTTGHNVVTATLAASAPPTVRLLVHEYSLTTPNVDWVISHDVAPGGSTSSATLPTSLPSDLIFCWAVDLNIISYQPPASLRVTAGSQSTGDLTAGPPGTYTITANTSGGGGPIAAIALQTTPPGTGLAAINLGPLATTVPSTLWGGGGQFVHATSTSTDPQGQ